MCSMCLLLYVVLDVLYMLLNILYVLVVVCGAQHALQVALCLLLSMLDMLHVCAVADPRGGYGGCSPPSAKLSLGHAITMMTDQ